VPNVPKRKKSEKPKILYQDKFIAVLDKPAGWVVNRAETVKRETIQDWIETNLKFKIGNLKSYRSGIVHRLDKDTSGILLVAKTPKAFENLQRQFKERRVKKRYWALVHGKVQPAQGIIRVPISRSPFDRKRFGIFLGGKEAETRYKRISNLKSQISNDEFTLLELEPKTGRTHQIRVHLKYIGHPVVGDEFYAGRKTVRADRSWCPRQFLHASAITLFHPETGRKVEFHSPLPAELKNALKYLEKCAK
jgi:23S rRNA pseudouridine1911/1915/1917 synthase